jgi:hypothetical protein
VRVTIEVDGASVTILPRRAPVGASGPIRGRSLAIFPGDPPSALGVDPGAVMRAIVEPGAQPGFAILDLGTTDAATLGRSLGLGAILYWDGRRAYLLPCDAPA